MYPRKKKVGTSVMKRCGCSCNMIVCVVLLTLRTAFLSLFFSQTQFVEIKGSVFKKFGKNNLFQMSNSGKIINVISEIFYLIHHFKS